MRAAFGVAMLLAVAILLALYLAFNLGANDVANAMGTSVGSKAVTLGQAIAIAGVLEFSGAMLLGQNVSARLITGIIVPERWQASPEQWLGAMVAVLLTAGLWLNIATVKGLPVSASHTVVGALTGVGLVAAGPGVIRWSTLGLISTAWVVTPLVSGVIAAGFYGLVQRGILFQSDSRQALGEWIPWLSVALFGLLGSAVFPALIERSPLSRLPLPQHDLWLLLGALGVLGLSSLALVTLRESAGTVDAMAEPGILVAGIEKVFGRFQVTSASFVAFAHGANDVGNAVAPMGVIVLILQTGQLPTEHFALPLWILALGGFGIVAGLALLGHRVIQTIGEDLIELEPSSGFCAELATAATVLTASVLGLPVSTSHALVGAVVGVGWVKTRDIRQIRLETVGRIALTWGVTVPAAAAIAALFFQLFSNLLL